MGSLSEYRQSVRAVRSIGWRIVWCPKYRKRFLFGPVADRYRELLRNLPTLQSKSYFVASVGRVFELTIRRYIGEQTTRPIRGEP